MQITHRKGELNKAQKEKLGSLLNMVYTTRELADHVGFSRRQIYRVYCHMPGNPFHKGTDGIHREVNGKQFREWYLATYPKQKLAEGEILCVACKRSFVPETEPIKTQETDKILIEQYICPLCGKPVGKFVKK